MTAEQMRMGRLRYAEEELVWLTTRKGRKTKAIQARIQELKEDIAKWSV